MNRINLRTLDLNLLRVFLILSETGSVSKAADLLGMSQPATSSALARLRRATDDQLFTRSKTGMIPTPYADAILPDVRHHMGALLQSLDAQKTFDPGTSEKEFRLSLSGLGELIFIPTLLHRLWEEAPAIRVTNHPTVPADLANALHGNKLDCAIGMIDAKGPGLLAHDLFEETYVFVAGHGLNDPPSTLAGLSACHLVVSRPEASYAADIERLLLQNGLNQAINLRLGHFGAIGPLLDHNPVVAVMPKQLAKQYVENQGARILSIPLDQPKQTVRLIWHERTKDDDAQRWLRAMIVDAFGHAERSV